MKFVSFVYNLQRALNNWAFKFKGLYFVILAAIACNGLKNLRGFSDRCQYNTPNPTSALLIFLPELSNCYWRWGGGMKENK